jgi:hypothetical protein
MGAQEGELIGEERPVEERDDGLGAAQREGAQPRALPPGEDDGAYAPGVQETASLMSMTGMPSRMG